MALLIGVAGTAIPVSGVALAPKEYGLTAGGRKLVLPYQGSHPLEGEQTGVRRVVIAIHGGGYNAQEGYNAVIIAAGNHEGEGDSVAIIAPQFLRRSVLPSSIPDNLLYWNNFPFRGTSSARYGPNAASVSISMFEVLDRILETVTDPGLFPNLETVVVTGFSAGGQSVNRYAIAGRYPANLDPAREIHMRFMVLSPSSYVYFTPERDADGDGTFDLPSSSEINSCGAYNEWGYGFEDLWSYPAGTGNAQMRQQYPKRFVFYLVGENDNNPNDPSLGIGCESNLQGPHRVARAQTYFNHLLETYGPAIEQHQSFHVVPGAGHSFTQNLNSVVGRRFLFDEDETDSDGDGQTDWGEWISGSDPANEVSQFTADWNITAGPEVYQLAWDALPGRRYSIRQSSAFDQPFTEVGNVTAEAEAGLAVWPILIDEESQFLRIQAQLN